MKTIKNLFTIVIIALLSSCYSEKSKPEEESREENSHIEDNYWQDGKAEIAIYDLQHNRYNAIHTGELISIFVTEDFLTEKQVKNESYTDNNSCKVLKNIRLRNFTTGIYEYNIQTTVFTPLERSKFPTLKVSHTSQEWCGTTFRQLNYKAGDYELEIRSYFEKEGDQEITLNKAIAEDELLNLIRMNPALLPDGEFEMIPSMNFLSLKHETPEIVKANSVQTEYSADGSATTDKLMSFNYTIPSQNREVKLIFEKEIPHRIITWSETYPSAFDGQLRTTTANLRSTKRMAYWKLNNLQDSIYRDSLGLK